MIYEFFNHHIDLTKIAYIKRPYKGFPDGRVTVIDIGFDHYETSIQLDDGYHTIRREYDKLIGQWKVAQALQHKNHRIAYQRAGEVSTIDVEPVGEDENA